MGEGDGVCMWIVVSFMFIFIVYCLWFLWVGMYINKFLVVNLSFGKMKWFECKWLFCYFICCVYGNELK